MGERPRREPELSFAKGHLEQHGKAVGSITVDGRRYELDAPGLRDHSWGPRYWQSPKCYRWLTMSFGDDLGAVPMVNVSRDGRAVHAGYVYRKGRDNDPITHVEIDTEWAGEQNLHDRIQVRARTRQGVAEGLTEWRWGDRVGYGLSEYLDHLVE